MKKIEILSKQRLLFYYSILFKELLTLWRRKTNLPPENKIFIVEKTRKL
ncbi:hypothetical protein CLOHYLEM_06503 [[Clostridium] hylemonae DSM 15053]|uniref:Uncharacterized protein n=1 Tax=[Clostridium] hylemonae DSM 15053 TaxID=553973 RepID=C0C343_9FIRM|nr:hypothetical protein CLOHYLEM_06503 [[Clostridium] hylemonae DSM 15053]